MSDTSSSSSIASRQWERVYLDPDSHVATAQALWPTGERTFVLDISFKGAAFRRPTTFELKPQADLNLEIDLKMSGVIKVQAKVMWISEEVVGVQFANISPDANMTLTQFLDDKLIGVHLREIEKQYYNDNLDCDFWFHGPSDVNFYFWCEDRQQPKISSLKQAKAEIPGARLEYQRDNLEVIIDESAMSESTRRLVMTGQKKVMTPKNFLLLRASDLLSQIRNRPQCVEDLLITVRRHML